MKNINQEVQNAQITVARMTYIDTIVGNLLRDYGCVIEIENDMSYGAYGVKKSLYFLCGDESVILDITIEFDDDNEPYFSVSYYEECPSPKVYYMPYQLDVFLYTVARELAEW